MKWIIVFIGMIVWGYINGFFSSDKTANPWITDDERETKIKKKQLRQAGPVFLCFVPLAS
ncbi:hypothetical protein bthur0013_43380 [Bacillus thuringiensis IBL 200]|nr:hypothetical protein bthur0013_43380 [Bacillus thuringiensis IBL 200]